MTRTYLHIAPQLDHRITHLAKAAKKPKATILREALELGLNEIAKTKKFTGTAALLEFAKQAEQMHFTGGPKDLALNHDKYTWDA